MERSYLRGACGLPRVDGENNESVLERTWMSFESEGMNCGMVEVIG